MTEDRRATMLPPQDLQAEQATLGACLIDVEALLRARGILITEDFYREAHRQIWWAICSVADAGAPVDHVTVASAMRSMGQLAAVGGVEYLAALEDEVVTCAHTVRYATIVARAGLLRRLIKAASDLQGACYDYPEDPAPVLSEHSRRIAELSQGHSGNKGARLVAEDADELFRTLEARMGAVPHMSPQRLGIEKIDRRMGGLGGHTLVVARGEEKAGKSMLATQILLSTARQLVEDGDPRCCVAYLLEGEEIWLERAMAWLGQFNSNVFTPSQSALAIEQTGFSRAAQLWRDLPLYVTARMSDVDTIIADIERINMTHPVALVLIDYAQLIKGGSGERDLERVEYRANRLAALAAGLRAPIVVPSQVTLRDGERHAKGARAWDEAASFSFDVERGEKGDAREVRQKSTRGRLRLHGCRRRPPFYAFELEFDLATGHVMEDALGGEPI